MSFKNQLQIWVSNQDLPDETAKHRLFSACQEFSKHVADANSHQFLRRRVEENVGGHTALYYAPDPEKTAGWICRSAKHLLEEVSEAFIDHLSRRGIFGASRIVEFKRYSDIFVAQAYEHNWQWALSYFSFSLPLSDEHWHLIADGVLAAKVRDLGQLANETLTPIPTTENSQEPAMEPDRTTEAKMLRRRRMLEDYIQATGNPSKSRIYKSSNCPIHKPEFHAWLKGKLPDESQTTIAFERFLRDKKPPIP